MGFLTAIVGNRAQGAPEARQHPANLTDYILAAFSGGMDTYTGKSVTVDSSLQSTAVYACVKILAESLGQLPLILYRRLDRGKTRAPDHPLYRILHDMPNPEMTAVEFKETLTGHVALRGNAYAEIEEDNAGRVRALWPLRPDRMEPKRVNGRLVYDYRIKATDAVAQRLPADRILHIRGFGSDGYMGYSPIEYERQAVALALGMEEFGARLYANGVQPFGVLQHPGALSPEAHQRLKQSIEERHQGLENAHRMMILEEGMQWKETGIPPEQAQFLEGRKYQVNEIARIFRVPPHMLADLERATFSNIEHQGLEFVVHTLGPWLARWEQRVFASLLSEPEQSQYFAEYLVDAFLRGDIQSRSNAYNVGIVSGYLTRNEARERENLNPLPGLDEPLVPLNMIEAGQEPPPAEGGRSGHTHSEYRILPEVSEPQTLNTRQEGTARERQRLIARNVRLFEDAAGRLVRRETADIRRAVDRHLGKRSRESFESWLANFYEDLRGAIPGYFEPLMETMAEAMFADAALELDEDEPVIDDDVRAWIDEYLANYTEVYAVGGEKQVRTLVAEAEDEEAAAEAVRQRMDEWEGNKAQKEGREQAFEAGNALLVLAYSRLAVETMTWTGGDCPLCRRLNGTSIPVSGAFAQEGDTVDPEDDETEPLPVRRTIKHGPLHAGCDCTLVAG